MKLKAFWSISIAATLFMSQSLWSQDFPEVEQLGTGDMNEVPVADPKKKTDPKAKKAKAPDAVLNFEGDMIEGEKRRPDLFLQTNVEDLSLDSILYLRKDFNDFHVVDHKRRPRHFRFKGKK